MNKLGKVLSRAFRGLRDAWIEAAIQRAKARLARKVKLEPWIDTTTVGGMSDEWRAKDAQPASPATTSDARTHHARINITRDDE